MINLENVIKAARKIDYFGLLGKEYILVDFLKSYNELQEKACSDPDAWREEFRKKQAAGVKYAWRDNLGNWRMAEQVLFCFGKERYREVVETPKPTIPHLESRKLWLAQREAGTNEVWQIKYPPAGNRVDIADGTEPHWCPQHEYRLKPKTEKYYFALCKWKGSNTVDAVSNTSREELQRKAVAHGFEIIGDIVERERETEL